MWYNELIRANSPPDKSELTELFRAREASCPKGKKMEQRRSLITRDCKEELKFERKLVVTVLAIILSKMGIIYSLQVKELKTPFIIIGIMLILLGAWLWFSSNFKVKIDACIKENHLVTSGVYSMVRNPIYSAFFLVCIGAFFIETNIILFVLPVVYYVYMTVFLIKTEEKWLSELYGQEYEEYCKNVNHCIPWTPKRK